MSIKLLYNGCQLLATSIVLFLFGCEAKIPEFAGIYVLDGGKYKEVPRFKDFKIEEFNHIRRTDLFMIGTACNVKASIPRSQFIPIARDTFNKKGFLVVQNKEWSEIKLFRVPTKGILKDNEEKGLDIVIAVDDGCRSMGLTIFSEVLGLHERQAPIEIDIKQSQKGENSFMYVPDAPLEKGFYLINFKLNGQDHLGYNPIVIK